MVLIPPKQNCNLALLKKKCHGSHSPFEGGQGDDLLNQTNIEQPL